MFPRKRTSSKAGMPPGTLIHIGEGTGEPSRFAVILYDETGYEEYECTTPDELFQKIDDKRTTWINVTGLEQTNYIQAVSEHFGIHPLNQEDIVNTEQRPKVEEYEEYLYLVIRMLMADAPGNIEAEQVSIIIGKNWIVSFQERPGDVFESVRNRLRTGKGRIRRGGADFLLYALVDAIVDGYFDGFEKLGDWMEKVEEELTTDPSTATLQKINTLKRDLIYLRKVIYPVREVAARLEHGDSELLGDATLVYFKDVYDHVVQVADTLETYRDIAGGMLDIYLSSVSNRMNEVMKVLTIIATIFIPLTFIVGLYGMNFRYMPELDQPLAYPAIIGVMIVIAAVEIIYFRMKRWI
jgi:magnesium transporter